MDGKRLAAIAFALVFAVSCSSSGATTGASAAATAAATTGATAAPTTGAASTAESGSQPKLADLLAAAKISQYKITSKIPASGPGAAAFSADPSSYLKPPPTPSA